MNPRVAWLLMRLYPRAWRERYGAEFEALLESGRGDLRTVGDIVWSALCEHVSPTGGHTMGDSGSSQFQRWCVRAPWAMFACAPVCLLAVAYFVACFILWSGWRIFLPGTNTPFVPVNGLAILYFGVGRWLYYGAPILVGWGIALIAARHRLKGVWPVVGLVLIALMGSMAQVNVSLPVSGETGGGVGIDFGFGPSFQGALLHVLVILSITGLPYLVWRVRRGHSLSA
jgi:hypothetical protein